MAEHARGDQAALHARPECQHSEAARADVHVQDDLLLDAAAGLRNVFNILRLSAVRCAAEREVRWHTDAVADRHHIDVVADCAVPGAAIRHPVHVQRPL